VIGTAAANIVMVALQYRRMRTGFNSRLEGGQTLMITLRILIASAITAAVARGVWGLLNGALGTSVPGQLVSVGVAVLVAAALYAWLTLVMRIPEARQIEQLVAGRLRLARLSAR
jgi:peptidoglycan biosynthesis protein MviN/MurJ (putative lipid II flippase)